MFEKSKLEYYNLYEKDVIAFSEIPRLYLTYEVCLLAIKRGAETPMSVWIPNKYKTLEMYLEFAKLQYSTKSTNSAEWIIKKFIPIKYREKALSLKEQYAHIGEAKANEKRKKEELENQTVCCNCLLKNKPKRIKVKVKTLTR